MATIKKPIKKAAAGSKITKAQTGYSGPTRQRGTDSQGRPHPIVEHINRKPVVKKKSKALPKGSLTQAELDALSHQKRGMGNIDSAYVKDRGGILNTLGHLTTAQRNQLENYMSKASTSKKIYEGLPNIGIPFGISAADIPKGSQLEDQRNGGKVVKKKAKSGATIAKKPIKKAPGGTKVVKGSRPGMGVFRTTKERTTSGGLFEPYKYKTESIDTTGYSKGRNNYEFKTVEGEGDKTRSKVTSTKSKTISKKDVPAILKSLNKAKDGMWMQKAAASIKKRGTAGKCTPITKPGCTGKAKALAKTFKKIAKSNKKK